MKYVVDGSRVELDCFASQPREGDIERYKWKVGIAGFMEVGPSPISVMGGGTGS